jgi:hypothetical protein
MTGRENVMVGVDQFWDAVTNFEKTLDNTVADAGTKRKLRQEWKRINKLIENFIVQEGK